MSLSGINMPGHGTLTLTPDHRFVYAPAEGFVGTDSFSYDIRDREGAGATASVTVAVAPQNAAPVAVDDTVASTGQAVTLDPLANDNDPDGDPLRLTALTLPIEGQITLEPDGGVAYTPPAGYSGTDSFTYQVTDGTATSEAEVRVSVEAPALQTFPNGYRYRRRIVIPPQTTGGAVETDFVVMVRETGSWLELATAGGESSILRASTSDSSSRTAPSSTTRSNATISELAPCSPGSEFPASISLRSRGSSSTTASRMRPRRRRRRRRFGAATWPCSMRAPVRIEVAAPAT